MPVVDASLLVDYLTGGRGEDGLRAWLGEHDEPLCAPYLIDAEVGHVLRRSLARGELGLRSAESALRNFADMPLARAGHVALLERAWELRGNVSFYDALYVALAEALHMTLLTIDARLGRARGVRAPVAVLG